MKHLVQILERDKTQRKITIYM